MGLTNAPTNGPKGASSVIPIRFGTLPFVGPGATSLNSNLLFNDGLGGFRAWIFQSLGPGNITVQPQFANGNDAGNLPDWRNLVPPFALALLVPSLTLYAQGAHQFRLRFTSTGVATVMYRMSGGLT